jgi:bifunctional UDP-N-acetylglucosamine pyrophosphorylase/glucosamine-1-phosphate N-acetyltransferase
MKSKKTNKVTATVGDKPMILHGIHLLQKTKISTIIVVVGFAKDSVKKIIQENVIFAEQKKRLGTGHAVSKALPLVPKEVTDVLIIQGDDSAFYKEETIKKLIKKHLEEKNALTFLTITVKNPNGLGRIVRDKRGNLLFIIEEKDATTVQRKINEINPACYVMNVAFLKRYLNKIKKSPVTGEYYLTGLIDVAIKNNQKINILSAGEIPWKGVNTKVELEEAQKLFSEINSGFASN